MLHKQAKNYVFMTGSQHFTPGNIQFQPVYDRGQCAKSSYLKLGSRNHVIVAKGVSSPVLSHCSGQWQEASWLDPEALMRNNFYFRSWKWAWFYHFRCPFDMSVWSCSLCKFLFTAIHLSNFISGWIPFGDSIVRLIMVRNNGYH